MDIEQVVDELSIRRLVDNFCDGVNSRDPLLWGSVWVDDDASFCLNGNDIAGKDAIVAGFVNGISNYEFLLQVTPNGSINVDGDSATGRWYILEIGKLWTGPSSQHVGRCHDNYVQTAKGWRLQRRVVEHLYKGEAALSGWTRNASNDDS